MSSPTTKERQDVPSMSSPSPLYKSLHQTATDFANSYSQDKAGKDITALSATLTPSCRRFWAPASILDQAPVLAGGRTNKEYEQQEKPTFENAFEKWHIKIHDLTIDEVAKKAVVHMTTYNTVKDTGKNFAFEFVFTLWMTGDGTKIEKVMEFCDTEMAGRFLEHMKSKKGAPNLSE